MAQDNPKNTGHPNSDQGHGGKDDSKDGKSRPASQTDTKNPKATEKGSAGHQSNSPTGSHAHGEKKTTP